jgi:hypothetical protein
MANISPVPKPENLRPWKPGESGNRGGHSKQRRMASALNVYLELSGETEDIIKALIKGAKDGSIQHIREVFDRVDGKLPTPVEVIDESEDGPDYAENPPQKLQEGLD